MKRLRAISTLIVAAFFLYRFQVNTPTCSPERLFQLEEATKRCESSIERDDSPDYPKMEKQILNALEGISDNGHLACDTLISEAYRVLGRIYIDSAWIDTDNTILLYNKARQVNMKAVTLRRRYFKSKDTTVSRIYHNIGITYFNSSLQGPNYFQKALMYGDSCFLTYPENVASFQAFYYRNWMMMGLAYAYQGDAFTGKDYLGRALKEAEKSGKDSDRWEVYMSMSDCYRETEQYLSAIQSAEKAVELSGYDSDRALTYLNLSAALQDSALQTGDMGLYKRAEKENKKALKIFTDLDETADMVACYRNMGELYRRMKKYDKAIRILKKGETLAKGSLPEDSAIQAELKINLGEVYRDIGQYNHALAILTEAINLLLGTDSIALALAGIDSFEGDKNALLMALDDIVSVYQEQANSNPNIKVLQQRFLEHGAAYGESITSLIELIRSNIADEEGKRTLSKRVKDDLARLFDVNKRLYQLTGKETYLQKSFEMMERSKYATLLKGLQLQDLENLPMGLVKLRNEEDSIYNTDFNQATAKRRREIKEQIRQSYPEYYALQYEQAIPDLAQIRNRTLEKDQTLLSYYMGMDSLYVFWLGPAGQGLQAVASAQDSIGNKAEAFVNVISDPNLPSSPEHGFNLYGKLIQPFEANLSNRLMISPDESFSKLPFEAISTSLKDSSLMLFRYIISYAFSAGLTEQMKSRRIGAKEATLAGFAPGLRKPLGENVSVPQWVKQQIDTFENILPNKNELSDISKHSKVAAYIGEAASKKNFLESCKRYAAAHIATHGSAVKPNPRYNFVLFDQSKETVQPEGILYADEFYGERPLNLEFIFFSACYTGVGHLMRGEGQFSMARALAYAGVKSFITTLWSVNAGRTSDLATHFYMHLSEGKAKDEALTLAKRQLSHNGGHPPHDWAGVTLTGEVAPLRLSSPKQPIEWENWAIGGAFAFPILWLLYYNRKRKTA